MSTFLPAREFALPRLSHLKSGKLASASKIAISATGAANWLLASGDSNMLLLSLRTSPYSTTGGISSTHKSAASAYKSFESSYYDFFVFGKKLSTAGGGGYGSYLTIANPINTTVSGYAESEFCVRSGIAGTADNFLSVKQRSFESYSIAVFGIPYNDYGNLCDPRSVAHPAMAVYEDNVIGSDEDLLGLVTYRYGSVCGAVDAIKSAWRSHSRALFCNMQEFSTGTVGWTNYIDHLVGTSGFTVDCKGRQLYRTDTTSQVFGWANAAPKTSSGALEMRFYSSKGSTTMTFTTGSVLQRSQFPIDCTGEDSITIEFRCTGTGGGYVFSAGVVEYTSTSPE